MLLAYNSNLHPAETVDEIAGAVRRFGAPLRERLGWERVGCDLRLGSAAIAECRADPARLDDLRRACDDARVAVTTINAFPLGRFQAPVVKEDAYRPDWSDPQRLADTEACIELAYALSDEDPVTISTVPGSYKPWGPGRCDPARIAAAFGRWAAAAWRAARTRGRRVVLCPEPEPWCFLETSAEVAAFWLGPLAEDGLAACAAALGGDRLAARRAIEEHLHCCFDTCHVSLAFEDQDAAAERLRAAGAKPTKLQVSAAPEVREPAAHPEAVAALRGMDEPRFLHQCAALAADGTVHRARDLDELDACLAAAGAGARAVRSHFHIPIDRPGAGGLGSTIDDSLHGLAAARRAGALHVSVETYTWSILAADERDALEGTARELEWLRERLA